MSVSLPFQPAKVDSHDKFSRPLKLGRNSMSSHGGTAIRDTP